MGILAAVLTVLASVGLARAAGNSGVIRGVVRDSSGKPAAGASVKARNVGKGITFLVISQEQGRYRIGNLPPGRYTVQALGGGMQSDAKTKAPRKLGDAQTMTADLRLTAWQDIESMTDSQYAAMMPEGEEKMLLLTRCTGCHGLENMVLERADADEWIDNVEVMRNRPFGMEPSAEITDQQRDELVKYLVKNWGPEVPSPNAARDLPKTWLQGAAAKYMAVEFEIPEKPYTPEVAVDSQGIAWVSEQFKGNLGRLDPDTMTYTRISLPPVRSGKFSRNAIAVDPQDRVWVMDGEPNDRLVQYDPKTGSFTTYPVPKSPDGDTRANTIRFHPNGNVWMTGMTANRIMSFNPDTKEFTPFPVPSGETSHPYGLAFDGKGDVWFTENFGARVSKLDLASGKITEYDVPTPDNLRSLAAHKGVGEVHSLRRMAADAEGNLWYGGKGLGKLGMIDYRTAKISEFDPPTPHSGPYSIDVDKKNNRIWFSEFLADQIARFDPRTKTFVEYPLPTKHSDVQRIEVDQSRPNRVWFAGSGTDTVGYVEVIE